MKRKNIYFATLLVLIGFFAMQSCTKVDDTTFSTKQAFTQPACSTTPSVRADGTVLFTGTTVTLNWASENSGGDPVKWNVYFGNGKAPAFFAEVTGNSVDVPVFDGLTYYWRVEIVDSRGIVTASPVNHFIAVNGTNAKMNVDMTAETNVKTAIGMDLPAANVIDLILKVYKKSDMSLVKAIDVGTSDETYTEFNTLPDGDYILAVDYYSAKNFGSFHAPISVSLKLKFTQLGFINQTLEFPGVIDNWSPVENALITNLATVTKAGTKYTIVKSVSSKLDKFVGAWKGTDAGTAYPSQVTCTRSGATMVLNGLMAQWMTDYWGEEITVASPVKIYFNFVTGTPYIPLQSFCTTRYWDAAALPPAYVYTNYNIASYSTTAIPLTFTMTGLTYPKVYIRYRLYSGSTQVSGTGNYVLNVTLDPAGLPGS